MILTFFSFMSLIRSMVWLGEGGMPGRGSTYPITSSPNRSTKFGHDR